MAMTDPEECGRHSLGPCHSTTLSSMFRGHAHFGSFFKTQFPIYCIFSVSKMTHLSKIVRPNVGCRLIRGSHLLTLIS